MHVPSRLRSSISIKTVPLRLINFALRPLKFNLRGNCMRDLGSPILIPRLKATWHEHAAIRGMSLAED